MCSKGCQRVNLMKADEPDESSSWGHNKKTLIITYKTFVKSVFNFGAPIWFPNAKPSNIEKLQIIQNTAMRLITGCHKASPIEHLHTECKLMPVINHFTMLCTQYLATCLCPTNLSHEVVKLPLGPGKNKAGHPLKETLASKF